MALTRRRLEAFGLGLAFWTLVAVLFACQRAAIYSARGLPLGPADILLSFGGIYTWAALTPLVLLVSRRFPLARGAPRLNILAHIAAAAVLVPADIGTYVLLDDLLHVIPWGPDPPGFGGKLVRMLSFGALFDGLWYAGVVAVGHANAFRDGFLERAREAARLEARLAAVRLRVLRMQLQPHFLFNTLNTIAALVPDDPAAARRTIERLRTLLRVTLANDARLEVPLSEELAFLESYVQIQRTRFEERLRVDWEVDPAALGAFVPTLILQPLVENAVRHGTGGREREGRIWIRASRGAGVLRLEVRDNGSGLPDLPTPPRGGIGLANTRERLRQRYGAAGRLDLANVPGGGLSVLVEIPLRFAEGTWSSDTPADAEVRIAGTAGERPAAAASGRAGERRAPLVAAPSGAPRPLGRLPLIAGITAAWLVFGALLAWQALLFTGLVGEPIPLERFWLIGVQSLAWAAFTFFIAGVTRRFPLGYGVLVRSLAAHAVACFAVWVAATGLLVAVDEAFGWVPWPSPAPAAPAAKFLQAGLAEFADVLVRYGLVVGIAHALSYRRLLREGERRAASLEDRLAQGELRLLTLQLQPQFLFDTLRAIAERVEHDPRAAERMLARLSELLRLVLESEDRHEVTLEEELGALDPYLKVQQMRLGGGLQVAPDVPDDALDARVPNLVLQPLVEHVLRHATARRPGRQAIAICARRRNGNLELEVREDGPGGAAAAAGCGPDLLSTRVRLQQMYGADHRLELSPVTGGGLRVLLKIPYRPDHTEANAAVFAAAAGASSRPAPSSAMGGRRQE